MKPIILFLIILLMWSCRSSRDASSSSRSDTHSETNSEAFSQVKDSLVEYFQGIRVSDSRKRLHLKEYYPQLDDKGQPLLKSEAWVDEVASETEESFAGVDRETTITENKIEHETTITENETDSVVRTETDGRPVQGREFIWVFIGIGAVMILNNIVRGRKN